MKSLFCCFILAGIVLSLSAQEKPIHEKSTYTAPDGKLYINKDLPIYLWVSDSPDDNSKKIRLKSEETSQYSNPMYFDVEGYNTLRSPSCVDPVTRKTVLPARDIIFEIYADSETPKTTIDYGKGDKYNKDGKIFVSSQAVINLSSKDALSGVNTIYLSIDSGAYQKYSEAIVLKDEKVYSIKYFSVDNVGNTETEHKLVIVYDKTVPLTKLEIQGDKYEETISARSVIKLSSEDKGIGLKAIMYSIDGGPEKKYQGDIQALGLSQGEHSIKYYAIDLVLNTEPVNSFSFYVDKTAPTIIEEVLGKTFFSNGKEFSSGKSRLKLTAFDNKAGVKEIRYSINGSEFEVYTKPVFLTQASGNLVIKAYAIDNVENKSASQLANEKTTIPYIDLTGPKLSFLYAGPKFTARDTVFINSKTKIKLLAQDLESGAHRIEYRIGDSEIRTYQEPFSIIEEGVHLISYTAYDNVENTSTSEFFCKVDNTGPAISYQFSAPSTGMSKSDSASLKSFPPYIILYLSAMDKVVGVNNISYQINNSPEKEYSNPISGLTSGEKTFKISSTDNLGNSSDEEIKINIE